MSIRNTIENDLRDYLVKAENMRNDDKLRHLMTLIDKHMEYQKLTHVIQKHEFSNIVSQAASNMSNLPINLHISGRKIDQYEMKHVAMIEAVISYMNRHELLKKQVNFNVTEEPNFESIEDLS
jgi:hypothetical protein